MNRRLPPLTALRAFEAAARHLSFTAAAVELNVTQGAISRQIRGLEARLGVALFDRFNRRVALTRAGATLLPSLTHALDLMAAGVDQVAPRPAARPPLRVSCLGTLAMRWLIPRLQRFKDRHPGIEVALTTSDGPLDPSRGGIDVAFRVGAAPWPSGHAVTPLFDEVVGPVGPRAVLDGVAGDPTEAIRRLPRLHTATRPTAWRDWAAAGPGRTASTGGRARSSSTSISCSKPRSPGSGSGSRPGSWSRTISPRGGWSRRWGSFRAG